MQKISVPSARPPVYTTAQRARQDGSVATSVPVTGSMNSNGPLLAHAGVDRVPAYRFVNERAHALHCIGRNFAPGATRCAVEIMSAHWMLGCLDAWMHGCLAGSQRASSAGITPGSAALDMQRLEAHHRKLARTSHALSCIWQRASTSW